MISARPMFTWIPPRASVVLLILLIARCKAFMHVGSIHTGYRPSHGLGRRPAKMTFLGLLEEEPLSLGALVADTMPDTAAIGVGAAFVAGGVAAAALAFKTAVYWRMQYVVAELLTNRIPSKAGGAEVLELSSTDTKTLYYMPKGIKRIILSTVKDLDKNLVNTSAVQAGVAQVQLEKQVDSVVNCPTATMDAVVSLYSFEKVRAGEVKKLVQEVSRVLKTKGILLFVEKGEPNQQLLDQVREHVGDVDFDVVQNVFDPYCVALAVKTKEDGDEESSGNGDNRSQRRVKKAQQKKAGKK
ncbi:unnamed protein product [Discosporangium mesarthrocarpum]